MSTVGITENVKGDNKKFEIWYNGREEVYIIQAASVELKNTWVSEIRKVLTGQLEACREASQLHQRITESVYHAPMNSSSSSRYGRKSVSLCENRSELSGLEMSNNRDRNTSPHARQKRGWPSRQMPSLDTFEDFEAIPSSAEELSNSSDMEEENHLNHGSNLYRVEGSYDACFPDSLTLEDGDLVQFIQEGEDGQWLVKKLVSEKMDWVPSSLLHPAEGDANNIRRHSNTDVYSGTRSTTPTNSEMKGNELARKLTVEQKAGS